MPVMVPCSSCGDLIRVKDDIEYQEPKCYNCVNIKKTKKVLDNREGSDTIYCITCGRSYVKDKDPYRKSFKCPYCHDSHGNLYWWKA